jgi:hypothetical protein
MGGTVVVQGIFFSWAFYIFLLYSENDRKAQGGTESQICLAPRTVWREISQIKVTENVIIYEH